MLKIQEELRKLSNAEKIAVYKNFFKTGKGEYGEGDIFLGLTSDEIKNLAKKYNSLSLDEIKTLILSKVHEDRMAGLRILVHQYKNNKGEIFRFYLENTKNINNWDLVDVSADKILGEYLFDKDKSILHDLAKSDNLWSRRIAIVSTYAFIKRGRFDETLRISEMLLKDKHDLIHKACGWMLREVGKRDVKVLEQFLKKNYKIMPRTMLRYAIERFDEKKRKSYLSGSA